MENLPPFFQEGDLVLAQSGGPVMRIVAVVGDGARYACTWTDEHGRDRCREFSADELEPFHDPDG
jgi:uncharacterized protein YodC (DUF2158 family)